jgi:hypothetical protein
MIELQLKKLNNIIQNLKILKVILNLKLNIMENLVVFINMATGKIN